MNPGKELDALIAEHVMDLIPKPHRVVYKGDGSEYCTTCSLAGVEGSVVGQCSLKNYSTDIAAAWTVVQRMILIGYRFESKVGFESTMATFVKDKNSVRGFSDQQTDHMPHAICLAALKSVDEDAKLKEPAK